MNAVVHPSQLKGNITAPASKSAMQRACAAALIRKGDTILLNPGVSNDDKAALDIIRQLGAVHQWRGQEIVVSSKGVQPVSNEINCHESGLSIRMFTSIAALSDQQITVNGSGSLAKRPMNFFDEVLPQLGVIITSNSGHLPIIIHGPMQPRNVTIDGSLSSQYLTGLLFAYAAADAKDVSIVVRNLNSKPYIDLTLQVLKAFKLKVPENRNYEEFYFANESRNDVQQTISYSVEGDWSGGAFLLTAAAIAGNFKIQGLDKESSQADKAVLQALKQSGADISFDGGDMFIRKSDLRGFDFNATDCPDLFPPLVSLASYCKGESVITGISRLTHKESNRAITLQQEFGKLGVPVRFIDDNMIIDGGRPLKGAEVSSHNDHRIAMATAVAALGAEDHVTVTGAEAVNKSYPQFWEHIKTLGAQISLTDN